MSKPRILLTRRWTSAVESYLSERYDVTLNTSDVPMTAAQLTAALRDYDAVCPTVTDALDAAVIEATPRRAKIIGNFGVGFNHIDVEAARRAGLVVTNTPDVLTDTTADLAITLMLMVARRAGEGERELRAGKWIGWRPTHLLGVDLTGKTLGLIGYGRIAQATARRAHHGFGMKVVYNSRRRASEAVEKDCSATYIAEVDELLRRSDVVSLHCPGGAETFHLLDERRLGLMRNGAILVNTARGPVIDELALVAALRAGRLRAGLDVYEQEPKLAPGLAELENVVLLPHLGSATEETRTAMGMRVAANLERFFAGEAPLDRVV
ncbi:MAG: D-glycerate dehydrogenase [Steroidobacteraceae bacterium]